MFNMRRKTLEADWRMIALNNKAPEGFSFLQFRELLALSDDEIIAWFASYGDEELLDTAINSLRIAIYYETVGNIPPDCKRRPNGDVDMTELCNDDNTPSEKRKLS